MITRFQRLWAQRKALVIVVLLLTGSGVVLGAARFTRRSPTIATFEVKRGEFLDSLQYRGEVIPSFALQAVMLWMRVTPGEVKIDIGSYIYLPQGKIIPINDEGSLLVNPSTLKGARYLKLNELLLAAQQHENKA